ncbi:MAG: SagB/ThcOx family dehydrogenase [Candidatus Krumholzibacteria bacterium]|nr:SagB/ThcOx family dehydrogenase [Candidatus Krumholzibacteria bacterium]
MNSQSSSSGNAKTIIALPAPRLESEQSLESALGNRRSIREYAKTSLSLQEVSQLLWATQGITADDGGRTAPSAGALYPLEIYLVAGRVASLDPGVYHYRTQDHGLVKRADGDKRAALARAALKQDCVRDGAAVVVFAAVYARTKKKYGDRGARYVHIEVGHAAQNTCLQATALGLGTVPVGAFDDNAVRKTLGLPSNERVLYLVPVGKIR